MFCLLDQDLLFWIVSSSFQKYRLFCFPFELHLVFSNSMAEQTPEQSVYGIPDFAFNSNGWGPGMQRLQSSTWALLWRAHA